MAPLNSDQLSALDRLVFEGGQIDVNAVIQHLIERGLLGAYYTNLMGPNTVSAMHTPALLTHNSSLRCAARAAHVEAIRGGQRREEDRHRRLHGAIRGDRRLKQREARRRPALAGGGAATRIQA